MQAMSEEFEAACRAQLEKYFAAHPDAAMQKQAMKYLRMLRASEKPLTGQPEGWAAGIIYEIANDARRACGVPGILNADFEKLMGVTISTARLRAARVRDVRESLPS